MSAHEPWPLVVEEWDDIGGVKVRLGTVVQIRCGCTDGLEHDFGHEQEAGHDGSE